MKHARIFPAFVSLGTLLLTGASAEAQRRSYYGGSFYPAPVVAMPLFDPFALPYYSYMSPTGPGEFPPLPAGTTGARIRVIVPDANAKVLFDGKMTHTTGTARQFHTPSLAPGGTYSYEIHATWMQEGRPTTQNRTVYVTPGQSLVVDFNQPAEKMPTVTLEK